jgi:HAD superfamily hydrolase (TIGR01450 family)
VSPAGSTSSTSPRSPLDFDGLIVDLDGVVWVGTEPVPGSVAALAKLRARGIPMVFLTNDPRSARADYADRLRRMGVEADEAEIVSAGSALATVVAADVGPGKTAFVIGSPSLKREVEQAGLRVIGGDAGGGAEVVLVGGYDEFNYDELRIAAQAVRRGARLYGAGRDATFPMPDGPWPGTGAILAAVETAAGRAAIVVGKPEPYMFDIARPKLAGCQRVVVVGDSLIADIAGGKRAGYMTVLVLSGVASREELAKAEVQPDLVVADLSAIR